MLSRDITAALPDGWDRLASQIAPEEWHRWHLSAKSSQTLAVGALGAAAELQPDLAWLARFVGPIGARPQIQFEHTVAPTLLGEWPRQTAIDVVVDTETTVLCIEVKWTERGLGTCRCGPEARSTSTCAAAVLGRGAYWTSAAKSLGIAREPGQPCQLGLGYQAVRLLAATRALASPQRRPVAILLYDGRNPYFAGNDDWEGWGPALTMATEDSPVEFVAIRWQDLVDAVPRDGALETWLADKHKLARTH